MYSANSFFMLRTPLFPNNYFIDYLNSNEDILEYLLKQKYYGKFKEAILASSKSLYNSLELFEKEKIKDLKKIDQLKSGILKYFSRSCTRATPYGYFAAVNMGYYSDVQNLTTDNSKYYKAVRPDMEWIYKFVKKIEEDITKTPNIKIKFSPIAYENGDRIYLSYSSNSVINTEQGEKKLNFDKDMSIKINSLMKFIFENLKNELEINKLVEKIKNNFKLNNNVNIYEYLQELINNEFIITEIKPILGKFDILSELILKLSYWPEQEENYKYLLKLKKQIDIYEKLEIGEGINELNIIIEEMQKSNYVKSPLQIDLSTSINKKISLENAFKLNLSRVSEFFISFTKLYLGFNEIRKYHEEFLIKYGFAKEVGILELLDENLGLGAPADYKFPQSSRKKITKDAESEDRIKFLYDKIFYSYQEKTECITLSGKDLKFIQDQNINTDNIPDSIEVYFQIINGEDNNNLKIYLSSIQNSYSVCASFGRFTNLFSEENISDLSSHIKNFEDKYPEIIFCELIFSPQNSRGANVVLGKSYWSYQLHLDTFQEKNNSNLYLNDIVVCANRKRLYFKSLKYQKEVVFVASNMLNFKNAPNIVRFLREVSFERFTLWNRIPLTEFSNLTFVPRIEYENIIIYPKSWNLSLVSLKQFKQEYDLEKDFLLIFCAWKKFWNVPDYINLIHADNKILLDLKKEDHVKELKKEFIRHGKLLLQENLEISFMNSYGLKNVFSYEIVSPLKSNKKTDKSIEIIRKFNSLNCTRKFIPGGEWFYSKLYFNSYREDEFISKCIVNFIQEVKKEIEIETWFFIRYQDPKKHIRLRILLKDKKYSNELLEKYNSYFDEVSKNGILNSCCIDSYEPEIERYGGPDLIHLAEKIFMYDSEIACLLIKNKKVIEKEYLLIHINSFLALEILENFSFNFDEKLNWLMLRNDKNKFIEEFRKSRKYIIDLFMKNNLHWYKDKIFSNLEELIQKRRNEIIKYSNQLFKNIELKQIYNDRNRIIVSFIHMQSNRLIGISKENEEKSNAFMLHTLNSLKFHLNKKNSL
ncbi:lantibiotic dehydratase [Pigmentibacter sp. JX0631]|uniref:lantibiotic dehydratase n=1 Tax=Pigmentibacter sp. JX0631 TaxID=2976982 RepID=UPI0024690589|nr:lantibiotic dehydratase [Pigmentibacter sp. JX0631]WGL61222.1 lantibiotic dehydratase [Pigmentibacter sp. JX0631]